MPAKAEIKQGFFLMVGIMLALVVIGFGARLLLKG